MRIATKRGHVESQIFSFTVADLRELVRQKARASSVYCVVPRGFYELVEISFDFNDSDLEGVAVATLTRTFTEIVEAHPVADCAVDPVVGAKHERSTRGSDSL